MTFKSWIRGLQTIVGRKPSAPIDNHRGRKCKAARVRLRLEQLEDRFAPSVNTSTVLGAAVGGTTVAVVTYGTPITFAATISPASGTTAPAAGSVDFQDGSTDLGMISTETVFGSNAVFTLVTTPTQLQVIQAGGGVHTITAAYSPGTGFNGSTGTLAGGLQVTPAPLTVTAAVTTGSWSTPSAMVNVRVRPSTTLLANGEVLVAGGYSGTSSSTTQATAELYNPATDSWSAAASMSAPRWLPGSALLPNGKVLVAGGGSTSGSALASAELYDPVTNTWSSAGNMSAGRWLPSTILLQNGKVLVVGGTFTTAAAELYDPATNTWSSAGSPGIALQGQRAVLLPGGQVLVTGGENPTTNYVASCELYNPSTNTWTNAAPMANIRSEHSIALLQNGEVLVAGGFTGSFVGTAIASAEIYNPATNTWSSANSMAVARARQSARLLPGGQVLVMGGENSTGALASAEIYDPSSNTWSSAPAMAAARDFLTSTLLPGGKMLVVGGNASSNPGNSQLFSLAPIANNKIYDSTLTATLNLNNLVPSGVYAGDSVTLSSTGAVGTFASKNVGNNITVTTSGFTIGGPQAGNYTLVQPTATANITPAPLTITATPNTKTYDSTASAAAIPTVSGLLSGDTVTGLSEAYVNAVTPVDMSGQANFSWVGNDTLPGDPSGIWLPGAPTGNVTLGGVPFNIKSNASGNQAWAAGTAANYGAGQESVTINVNVFGVTNVYTLINTWWGRTGPSSYAALTFTGSGGATYTKNLIGGSDIRDYNTDPNSNTINGTTTTNVFNVASDVRGQPGRLDMQQIALPAAFATQTLTTVTLVDTGGTLLQRTILDGITVGAGAIGNLNVGAGKALNVSAYSVNDGNGGANYVVTTLPNTVGVITAAPLTITAVTNTKTYDSTTTATALPTVNGLAGGDTVTGQKEVYSDANVGSSKTLSVSAYTVNDGNGGNNYSVTTVANASGLINAAPPFFTVPYNATLYLEGMGGSTAATAVSEFGIGTSIADHVAYLTGLPFSPNPSGEAKVGTVTAGENLNFYIKTVANGSTFWAFSILDTTDQASIVSFTDPDHDFSSSGSIVVQTSPTTWVLHLDDAPSYMVDDDDNDVLVQIRLDPNTAPANVNTTTTVAAKTGTAVYGTPVTLTATVSPATGTAAPNAGSVDFQDGSTDLGMISTETVSGSNAVFTLVTTPTQLQVIQASGGVHTITATYSPGTGFNGSSASLNGGLTVNPAPLTVTAVANTKVYDSTTSAAAVPTVTGLVGGDTVTGLAEVYSNSNASSSQPSAALTGLKGPNSLVFDAAGNLYVANGSDGTVSKFAPGATTPAVTFNASASFVPDNLAFDAAGNLYVASTTSVSKFAPGATSPLATLTGLTFPASMAFDANGNLYVVNASIGGNVSIFAPGATSPTGTLSGLNNPIALAFDAGGNLYVSNSGNNTVSKFAPGATTPSATLTGLNTPDGLAFDQSGKLYVANSNANSVSIFAPGANTPTATLTGISSPHNLAFDQAGNLFVVNSGTAVAEFAPGATTPNNTLTGLSGAFALAFDTAGNLYVANSNNSTVSTFASASLFPNKILSASAYTVNDGNGGNNYAATLANNSTGAITPAPLTITATTYTKTYNNSNSASAVPTVAGLIGNDSVTNLAETFSDKNAGSGKTLSVFYTLNDNNGGANYAVSRVNSTTGVITKASLTITALGNTKTYDGTTAALAVPSVSGLALPDSVSGRTEVYADKNAGSNKILSVSNYTISDGNGGNNYVITTVNYTAGVINQAPLTFVTTRVTKTYDSTTRASATPFVQGLVGSDKVTNLTEAFNNANANAIGGTGKIVSISSYTINDGNNGNNYSITTISDQGSTITRASLGILAVPNNKTFDSTTTAAAIPTVTGLIGNDTVTGLAEVYTFKNTGSGTLSVSAYTVNDPNNGGNYFVTTSTSFGSIGQAPLTIAATPTTKTYDATTSAGAVSVTGLFGNDTVTGLTEKFADTKVGTGKTVTVNISAFVLHDGNSGQNYNVMIVNSSAGQITPAPLTITAVANTKTYDSTVAASTAPAVSGLFGSDSVTRTEVYTDRNVGTGKTISVSAYTVNDGNGGNNYTVTTVVNTAAVINIAPLTITSKTYTKTYDSTTSAAATPTVSGLKGADSVTGLAEVYSSTNAAAGRTLSVLGSYLVNDGNSGNNYAVTTVSVTTGVINKAALTITAVTNTKSYDSTTTAAANPTVTGLLGGDSITGLTEVYSDATVGTGKTLSVSAYTISDGNGGNNYTVTKKVDVTGVISPAVVQPFFVVPYDATLYLQAIGGTGGATTEFGIGTSMTDAVAYFTNLPHNPVPSPEVQVGPVTANTSLNFYMKTVFAGTTYWAFSDLYTTDPASITAFTDTDHSFSPTGSIIVQTSPTTWVLHLDDAASYKVDDNDNDVLIQIRLAPLTSGNVSTTTTVSANTSTAVYGTPVTLTATVSPATGTTAPTAGSVDFMDGTTDLGAISTETVSGGNAVFTLVTTPKQLQVIQANGGVHTITATYSPGSGFNGSTGTLAGGVKVTPAPLTITATTNTKTYDSTTTAAALPTVAGLVSGDTVTGLSETYGSSFAPVDMSSQANFSWIGNDTLPGDPSGIWLPGAPTGNVTLGGVPFNIKSNASGNQAWAAGVAANYGAGQESVTINVNAVGVTDVFTLINTWWGQSGPTSYAALTFTGSQGATYTKNLIGNDDIRDYNSSVFTSNINGTTTVNVFNIPADVRGMPGVLDMQHITLPAAFATQTLTTITLVDTGGTLVQRAILDGITVESVNASAANVGTGKTLNVNAYSVNDGNGGKNYTVTTVTNTTGVITQAALTITATTNTKTYDSTTTATAIPTVSGLIGGDTATGLAEVYGPAATPGGFVEYGNENVLNTGSYSSDPKAGATLVGLAANVTSDATLTVNFHSSPFTPSAGDYPGTDQIYVGSTQTGSHDGYSVDSPRINGPQVIMMNYSSLVPAGQTISTLTLGIAADDFQFPVWGQPFTAKINGIVDTALTNKLESFDETGPKVHFFTIGIDPSTLQSTNTLTLTIDEGGDGGDGWAIDFLTVGVNTTSNGPGNPNVGTGKALSVSSYTVNDGNGGANYAVTTVANATGVITPAPLTLAATTNTKTFDSTTTAAALPGVTGLQGADTITGLSEVYALPAVTQGGFVEYGNENLLNTGTYSSDPKAGATLVGLAPNATSDATLSVSHANPFSPSSGDYAGTDQIYVGSTQTASHDGYASAPQKKNGPQVITMNYASLVPAGQPINSLTLGIAADDFQFPVWGQSFTAKINGSIDAALTSKLNSLSETGATVHFFTIGIDPSLLQANNILTLSIDEGGDGGDGWAIDFLTVGVNTIAGGGNGPNVGTGKTLRVSSYTVHDGNGGANYAVTTVVNTTGVITKAPLTITAVANTKTYDSTTTAAALPTVSGLQGGDSATGLAEAYSDKNAGVAKTLSVISYSVNDGNAGNNYSVTTVANTTGVINKAALTIAATTNAKTYDATTNAAASPTVSRLVGGDTVTGLAESYSDKNAGSSKTLSVSNYAVNDGSGGNNYSVTTVANTTGTINKAPLTVTASASTKTYDSTTNAAAIPTVAGLQGSDTTTGLAESYSDKNVGMSKMLSVTAYVINDDNSGNNYTVTTVATTTGLISQASLTITATTNTKPFDGSTSAAAIPTVTGLLGADMVTGVAEVYASSSPGSGKPLSVSAYVIGDGNVGNNYAVTTHIDTSGVIQSLQVVSTTTSVQGLATAIYGTPVTFTITVQPGASNSPAPTGSVEVFASGMDLGAAIQQPPVGGAAIFTLTTLPKTLNVGGYVVTANFTPVGSFTGSSATLATGLTVTPKPLVIKATTNTKPWDGTLSAAALPTVTGLVSGDTVTGLAEVYNDTNVATGKTLSVNPSFIINDGNSGKNYTVTTAPDKTGVIGPPNPVLTLPNSLAVIEPPEGMTVTVNLTLTVNLPLNYTVNYQTVNGSALAGTDFVAINTGTIHVNDANNTLPTVQIPITIHGGAYQQPGGPAFKSFTVQLNYAVNNGSGNALTQTLTGMPNTVTTINLQQVFAPKISIAANQASASQGVYVNLTTYWPSNPAFSAAQYAQAGGDVYLNYSTMVGGSFFSSATVRIAAANLTASGTFLIPNVRIPSKPPSGMFTMTLVAVTSNAAIDPTANMGMTVYP